MLKINGTIALLISFRGEKAFPLTSTTEQRLLRMFNRQVKFQLAHAGGQPVRASNGAVTLVPGNTPMLAELAPMPDDRGRTKLRLSKSAGKMCLANR